MLVFQDPDLTDVRDDALLSLDVAVWSTRTRPPPSLGALRSRSHPVADQAAMPGGASPRSHAQRDADGHDLADVVRMSRVEREPGVDRHVAIHEAAHNIAFFILGIAHLVDLVDIEGDGTYGGKVIGRWPAISTRTDFENRSIVDLAGRAAEELLLGVATRGAAGDLQVVTKHARDMRYRYGMRDRISALGENDRLTPHEAEVVELDVKEAHAKTLTTVVQCRYDILHLADALVERRYLDGKEA